MTKPQRATRAFWVGAVLSLSFQVGLSPGIARAADPEEAQYNAAAALVNAGQWQAGIKKIEDREKLDLPDAMRAKYVFAKGHAYEAGKKPCDAFPSVPAKGTKVPVNFCRNFRGQGADQATHLQNWFSVYEGASTNCHHPRLFGVLEWP